MKERSNIFSNVFRVGHQASALAARLLIVPIRVYQYLIAPLLPPACRFHPSCSHYAVEALHRHGAIVGTGLTVWRLLRCQPFHPGGYDPVPEEWHLPPLFHSRRV